jgi:hypothetical protein
VRQVVPYGTFAAGILALAAGPLATSSAAAAPRAADVVAATSVRQGLIVSPSAEITATWQLDVPPGSIYTDARTGTITVSGTGFTPGDTILIRFDTASGPYSRTTTAAQPYLNCGTKLGCTFIPGGHFTINVPGVGCGVVPASAVSSAGEAGIGAVDAQNGVNANAAVATPCPQLIFP